MSDAPNAPKDAAAAAPTKRLYFDDCRLTEFEARVMERRTFDGKPAVILDQTAFYPESGGQPPDHGTLDGADVVNVQEDGERIVHVLTQEIAAAPGAAVRGKVDWARRFDHMQQHSGQHVLSQAFDSLLNGRTLSFHLGAEGASVEIGLTKVDPADLRRVEEEANRIVFEDREVKTQFVPQERVHEVPLRKPPKVEGIIRVVEIGGYDWSACGGTHVRRTGEIGLIKVVSEERIRGNLRFEFLCGGRALRDYGVKNGVARELALKFNVPPADVPASVERLGTELKDVKRRLKKAEERLAGFEAAEFAAKAQGKVVSAVLDDRSPEAARALALAITRSGEFIVVFGAKSAERAHVIAARSEKIALDLRPLAGILGPMLNGRGGGGPSLIEVAGDVKADLSAAVAKAVEFARAR